MNRFRESLAAGVLIGVIGIVSYAGSLHNGFVWDDSFQIVRNPYLHPDQPWQNLFTSDVWGYTHPGRSGISKLLPPPANAVISAAGNR